MSTLNISNEYGRNILVSAEFTDGDDVCIRIEGPNSLSENILTRHEAEALLTVLSDCVGQVSPLEGDRNGH